MKIAVPSKGKDLESEISRVFGRCSFFIIVDLEDGKIKEFSAIENKAKEQTGGAGILAGQIVGEQGAGVVISMRLGPKAKSIVQQANMRIYLGESGTVKENIEKFLSGKLKEIER